jgi:hypothetical protein
MPTVYTDRGRAASLDRDGPFRPKIVAMPPRLQSAERLA